ncbi:MAG: GntR family transcriptional regulator [Saprospiraceae bacterium]
MDFKQQKAIYIQIADYLLENILAGELNQGDKVQSVREMAATVQVNPNTVVRSFNYLQDKGIIVNQRGIGYFVADDALEKTQALKRENFIQQELPQLFKMMELLDMKFDDLKAIYHHESNGKSS